MRSAVAWLSEPAVGEEKQTQLMGKLHAQGITTFGRARMALNRYHVRHRTPRKNRLAAARQLQKRFKRPA